jgi:hypothetical protein
MTVSRQHTMRRESLRRPKQGYVMAIIVQANDGPDLESG